MATQRPNILLITTDQQRFDASGSGGPSFLRTPHYDHLRREGVDFCAAYADCPICVPARVGIMTGRYVFGHQMPGNGATSGLPAMQRLGHGQLHPRGRHGAAL